MTGDVRLRPPRAAASCLGVLLMAAVVGLYAQLAGPTGLAWAGGQRVSQQVVSSSVPGWAAGPGGEAADTWDASGAGLPDSRPTVLPRGAEVARAVVTTAGVPVAPGAWWFVLPALVLGVVLVSGPRTLHPRAGAQQHRTRAPPVRA